MNVLIVVAHPDTGSFNHALADAAKSQFVADGHDVRVRDLYASGFRPLATPADFEDVAEESEGFAPDILQQRQAEAGTVPEDIAADIDLIRWCDLLVLQFPIWWFSAPAILKGWFERVLVKGITYGGGRKHGSGVFQGRHGLVSCTTGTPGPTYAPDGIEGDIERLLWPVNNGIFHYLGMTPYRPFVSFAPRTMDDAGRAGELARYATYVEQLGAQDELPMHAESDYGADHRLRPDVVPRSGFQYRS